MYDKRRGKKTTDKKMEIWTLHGKKGERERYREQ